MCDTERTELMKEEAELVATSEASAQAAEASASAGEASSPAGVLENGHADHSDAISSSDTTLTSEGAEKAKKPDASTRLTEVSCPSELVHPFQQMPRASAYKSNHSQNGALSDKCMKKPALQSACNCCCYADLIQADRDQAATF